MRLCPRYWGGHPDRGGVDQQVGFLEGGFKLLRLREKVELNVAAGAAPQLPDNPQQFRAGMGVKKVNPGGPVQRRLHQRRRPGPAGPQLDHPLAPDLIPRVPGREDVADAVGGVAGEDARFH